MSRLLLAALMVLMPLAASAATLTVRVEKINKKGGDLHVALYNEVLWPNDDAKPIADRIVPAVAPETSVVFEHVAPGVYGVKTYQDINRNGRFDQNWLGLPEEPYGFSGDARPILSEPGFNRTKFTVSDGDNEIVIHLQ
ncbi:MAG: DUF2141 domain-containing protein [Alphaproteobacteria bacterium]|nr:DUF2141 domain-containing protein [Alphaproteobacteria bacterium]MDE2493833.1 DUF2141 domain-containing protein [Alphaproteobacteria bacterium]